MQPSLETVHPLHGSVSTKSGLPTESTLMEFGTLRREGWDQTVICRRASSSSHFGNSLHASAGSQCGIRQRLMHHLATPRGQYTCKTFNLIPHFQRNYFICNFADGFAQEIWQISNKSTILLCLSYEQPSLRMTNCLQLPFCYSSVDLSRRQAEIEREVICCRRVQTAGRWSAGFVACRKELQHKTLRLLRVPKRVSSLAAHETARTGCVPMARVCTAGGDFAQGGPVHI